MIALYILLVFLFLIIIGLPIGFAIGIVSIGSYLMLGGNLLAIPQRMVVGIDFFTFLAIPLFILSGKIMNKGGITESLVNFSKNLVGHIAGGFGHVNVISSMLFAGLSGTATADLAALGPIEMALMEKGGYDKDFSAAVTAASAIIGPIIPPSVTMIIYAVVAKAIICSCIILAGIIPGF